MSELLELRLEIEPGVVKATGTQLSAKAPGGKPSERPLLLLLLPPKGKRQRRFSLWKFRAGLMK